jgi:uncharacterized protein YndB with AHSA1/START domain
MNRTISFAPVRKTIRVKAGQSHAFRVFTTGGWWPKSHSILASRSPQKEVVIEPRAGGRWFERGEDGSECDWGKVLEWEPPGRLLLTWSLNGLFQYDPALVTEVEVTFIPDGADATRVELEHRYFERAGDTAEAMHAAVDSPDGWRGLLERFAQFAAQ